MTTTDEYSYMMTLQIIMLSERIQKKEVHNVWFHMYKFLENANI